MDDPRFLIGTFRAFDHPSTIAIQVHRQDVPPREPQPWGRQLRTDTLTVDQALRQIEIFLRSLPRN